MEILHVAVLLAVIINAQAEVPVKVGEASVDVATGEAAELSCTTTAEILFCTFTDPTGNMLPVKAGVNYDNNRITFLGSDPKKDCGVKIDNVQDKDNGEWKCTITALVDGSAKQGIQTATVTVVKPPTSVLIDGQSDKLVLTYPENSNSQVKCVAEGGRPAPKFTWMLGDEPYVGKVTDEEGAQTLTYISKPEDNAKALTCVVLHPGYKKEILTANKNKASINLDIRFKPVASTEDIVLYGMTIGESYDVFMNFKSHPDPTDVHWEMHDKTIVPQGSESINRRFVAGKPESGPHAGYFTAKLTINKVDEKDQNSVNKLIVKNELGETEYRFSLGVGEKPAVEANSGQVVIIVVVVAIIVIIIAIAVLARAQGMLCFADKNAGDDVEKSAAQFEALEKGEPSPEKEMIKEPLTEVKKEPEPVVITETVPEPIKDKNEVEKEEKRSNGAHTPV